MVETLRFLASVQGLVGAWLRNIIQQPFGLAGSDARSDARSSLTLRYR
ncbi:MAG: hypothetical protein KME22_14060 [Hassallia sp. WJT32-NPBG1]|nr:hypothetical protein [Hassallia sp. WJT32-NPBG1]